MTDRASSSYSAAELGDPNLGLGVLTQLAQERHDLWPWIINHPDCSAELAAWIRPQLPGAQTAAPAAAQPKPRDPSAEQMAAGAKQMAAGAKEFFNTRVAPAAQGAARSVQSVVNEQRNAPQSGTKGWMSWAPFALPVAAFLSLVSLFLPVASGFGLSFNFFSEYAGGEGVVLLVLLLLVIAAGVLLIITRQKWAKITAGALGIVVGVFTAIDGFGTMVNVSGIPGASVGAGAVLLAIFSIVIIAAAVICLLPQQKAVAGGAAVPPAPPVS